MNETQQAWQFWLGVAKDGFQIAFFIVVGGVTILTYLKARRTLLQPIKTEIFKEQIKVFAEILRFFTGKGELDLRQEYGINDFFEANVTLLYDSYAYRFFDIEMDEDERPHSQKKCGISILTQEYMKENMRLVDEYIEPASPEPKQKSDPRTNAAVWSNYKFGEIRVPNTLTAQQDELNKLKDSPLVPADLVKLIEEYQELISENMDILAELLTESAKEMPNKYPTPEDLKKSSFGWIHTEYNHRFLPLSEKASAINVYLRQYFTSDTLFD